MNIPNKYKVGILAECDTWFAVTPEEYEKVKKLNEMTTEQLRNLSLSGLSSLELHYLVCVGLLEAVYTEPESPPSSYNRTNNERIPFDMKRVPIRDKNMVDRLFFDLPPRFYEDK